MASCRRLLFSLGVLIVPGMGVADPAFYGVSDGRIQAGSVGGAAYYEGKERGWFWYEDPPEEDVPPEPMPPVPVPAKPKPDPVKAPEASPLSSEWFRKNMEKYRDKAIDNPSNENVTLYMYLQRVMLDKAERFAEASQVAVMSDAMLDENTRRPIATFGSAAKDEMATKGTEQAAKKLAATAGLWFFYSSDCNYCIKESGVLQGLRNTYGFKVLPIALDGLPLPNGDFRDFIKDQGQAKKMGVDTTPALFLVKPGNNGGVIQLGQGLLSGEELVGRAITLAHQQGWLSDGEYDETRKVKPLEIDNKTIDSVDEKQLTDPRALVETLRRNLKQQL